MAIAITYEKKEDIPSGFESLYTEVDGKWKLTGVDGMVTQEDVDTVKEALRKERDDHKGTKEKLRAWDGLEVAKVKEDLAKIPELEAKVSNAPDEEKIEQIVNSRIAQKTGPLETQIRDLNGEKETLGAEVISLKGQIETRDRNDIVRGVAAEMKVQDTAIPDVLLNAQTMMERDDSGRLITRDGIHGVTPGLDVKGYLKEMQKIRPHWWPPSEGGGAPGSRGGGPNRANNPFSREHWNLTEQGRVIREEGREAADTLAKAAGTTVGGGQPAKAA